MLGAAGLVLSLALAQPRPQPLPPPAGEVISYAAEFDRPIADWFLFDMDGDGRRDVFVLFDEGGGRWGWELALQTRPRKFERRVRGEFDGVVALALGAFRQGDDQQLAVIRPTSVQLQELAEGEALQALGEPLAYEGFARSGLSAVPGFWHWAQDLDADGHDDLQLPGPDGVLLYFGRGEGRFEDPVELSVPTQRGASPAAEGFVDIVQQRPRPVFRDLDGDELPELCWFDQEGLWFRRQGPARVFAEAQNFTLSWNSGSTPGVLERTDIDLEDLNADGRADLVLSRMNSKEGSLAALQTTLVVLCSRGGEEPFLRRPDLALVLEGVVGSGPHFSDVDGDGRRDLSFSTYTASGGALGALFGKVGVSAFVHRGTHDLDAPFSGVPDATDSARIDADDFERWRARAHLIVHEDLTDDGLADRLQLEREGGGHSLAVRRGIRANGVLGTAEAAEWSATVQGMRGIAVRTLRDGEAQSVIFVKTRALRFLDLR